MREAWRLFASSLLVFFEHGVHREHGEKHGEIKVREREKRGEIKVRKREKLLALWLLIF